MDDTAEQVARLRETGGDHTSVEVKSAAGGLPESLTSSLSALANLPGGGTIILGLDERTGFTPVALRDVQALKQGLANKARAYTPPVTITIRDGTVDGSTVVVARVAECPAAFKPCRVTSTGKAYGRSYDGDFELSELEREAFIIGRGSPQFDR
ncbi:MAG TPA: ATP-binding protein, partial [Candidatus Limnocylindrales bacterium]